MADKTKQEIPEGMIPWEQTEEAMDLGDSHPEDDIWVDGEGNPIDEPDNPDDGDSRTTGESTDEPATGAESPTSQPTQPSGEVAAPGIQGEPQEAQGEPQEGQEPQGALGQPQTEQEPQGDQEQPQEGEGEELSVDDPAQAQQLLQSIDQMDRSHLMQVAKLIWGDDYEPGEWANDAYLREDVRGSLMDVIEGQGGGTRAEDEKEEE